MKSRTLSPARGPALLAGGERAEPAGTGGAARSGPLGEDLVGVGAEVRAPCRARAAGPSTASRTGPDSGSCGPAPARRRGPSSPAPRSGRCRTRRRCVAAGAISSLRVQGGVEQLLLRLGQAERGEQVLDAVELRQRDLAVLQHRAEHDPVEVTGGLVAAALLPDPLEQALAENGPADAPNRKVIDTVPSAHGHTRRMSSGPSRMPPPTLAPSWRAEHVVQHERLRRLHHRLLRRDVAVLALARAEPLVQGDEGGVRGVAAGVRPGLRHRAPQRRPVGVAGQQQLPAGGQARRGRAPARPPSDRSTRSRTWSRGRAPG